jgi:hypothetical protein
MTAKRTVTCDGSTYKVRSDTIEIPDFGAMTRIAALQWMNRNTYARGYSRRAPNPLAGLGTAITVSVR